MFRDFFVKRKTRKFIVSMSQVLAKDYGASSKYTEGQVKAVLKKLGYSQEFKEVTIGVFCNEEVAKAFGMDEALVKKYRGYPREHNIYGIGTYSNDVGVGGDAGGSGE